MKGVMSDMKTETYASLHNHTDYSNLKLIDSINKVEDLIDYAYELGLKAVAITDHETVSSFLHCQTKSWDKR